MFANSKLGGDIHQGDLIAVANGNDFTVGIYFGRGRGGTVQFYHPSSPVYTQERYDKLTPEEKEKLGPLKLGGIWKDFINTPRDTRIMKLNRENITDPRMQEDFQKSKEILAQFNITVNY
jgi:hypothetical protein